MIIVRAKLTTRNSFWWVPLFKIASSRHFEMLHFASLFNFKSNLSTERFFNHKQRSDYSFIWHKEFYLVQKFFNAFYKLYEKDDGANCKSIFFSIHYIHIFVCLVKHFSIDITAKLIITLKSCSWWPILPYYFCERS